MNSTIIDRGRGPEIAGTRITVFDIMEYLDASWEDKGIAAALGLYTDQVEAARNYIEQHSSEVREEFFRIKERIARGNSSEVEARLAVARASSVRAWRSWRSTDARARAMASILADANVEGQFRALMQILGSASWRELWIELGIGVVTFDQLGLAKDVSDRILWRACQERDTILITGNRNAEGPESLEVAIRLENMNSSPPVLTLADPDRIFLDRTYAELVVERLLEVLIDLDGLRGVGRIYLP